jgi:hypothetical protein
MAFLTEQQRAQMLANGAARASGRVVDPYPVVKLYTLDAPGCSPNSTPTAIEPMG